MITLEADLWGILNTLSCIVWGILITLAGLSMGNCDYPGQSGALAIVQFPLRSPNATNQWKM